jgi:membrane-associated phospholipid phosphatase
MKRFLDQFARLRRAEQLLALYFLYTTAISLGWGTHGVSRMELLAWNVLAVCALLLLPGRNPAWREWFPYPATLLCYREAGWMGTVLHTAGLEQKWIVWDRLALDGWHVRALIESLGAAIPTLLEAAYLSVYVIGPLAVVSLYLCHRRDAIDRLWLAFLLGLMLSYAQFPFWPSEPPRSVFAGQDLPSFLTPLRHLNLLMVGNYGIHSSVFPSAHVSGSLAGALMLGRILKTNRWVGNALLTVAILIAVGTVYGRYHYLVDALAGSAAGVIAYRLARRIPDAEAERLSPVRCSEGRS